MPALWFRVNICLNLLLKFSAFLRQTECCSDKNDLKRLGYPTFIRLFKIRLNNSSLDLFLLSFKSPRLRFEWLFRWPKRRSEEVQQWIKAQLDIVRSASPAPPGNSEGPAVIFPFSLQMLAFSIKHLLFYTTNALTFINFINYQLQLQVSKYQFLCWKYICLIR